MVGLGGYAGTDVLCSDYCIVEFCDRMTAMTMPLPRPGHLTLVGTVHRDSRGEERLARLLRQLAPDELTLEMSPTSLRYREERGHLLLQRLDRILTRLGVPDRDREALENHPALADIRSLIALPFEYRAAADYAKQHRIPLSLIDLPEVSQRKLQRVESELITLPNLRALLAHPALPASAETYHSAAALVLRQSSAAVRAAFLAGRRGSEGIGPRDREMAATIRRHLDAAPQLSLVHIGGWVHLIDDPAGETLFSLLSDLAPQRLLLDGDEALSPAG